MSFINTYKDIVLNPGQDFEYSLINTGAGAGAAALGADSEFGITFFNTFKKSTLASNEGASVTPLAAQPHYLDVAVGDATDAAAALSGVAEAGRAFTIQFTVTALNVEAVYGRDSRDWGRNIQYSFKYNVDTPAATVLADLVNVIDRESNEGESQFDNPYIRIDVERLPNDVFRFTGSQNTFTFELEILDEYGRVLPTLAIEANGQRSLRLGKINAAGTAVDLTAAAGELFQTDDNNIWKNTSGLASSDIADFDQIGQIATEGINTPELIDASIRLRTDSSVYPYALREHELALRSAIPGYKSFTIRGNHFTEGLSHKTTHVIYVHPDLLATPVTVTGTSLTQAGINTAIAASAELEKRVKPVTGGNDSLDAVLTAFAANL